MMFYCLVIVPANIKYKTSVLIIIWKWKIEEQFVTASFEVLLIDPGLVQTYKNLQRDRANNY